MKKFVYGILFAIGLRRIAVGLTIILTSPQVKNVVEDVVYTGVDRFLHGDELATARMRRRTRARTQGPSMATRHRPDRFAQPQPGEPFDHEAHGL